MNPNKQNFLSVLEKFISSLLRTSIPRFVSITENFTKTEIKAYDIPNVKVVQNPNSTTSEREAMKILHNSTTEDAHKLPTIPKINPSNKNKTFSAFLFLPFPLTFYHFRHVF